MSCSTIFLICALCDGVFSGREGKGTLPIVLHELVSGSAWFYSFLRICYCGGWDSSEPL